MRKWLLSLLCIISTLCAQANGLLRADYPEQYTVKPGDTLWSIAAKFLNRPWEWQKLWRANPSIHNPDLIYPGAVLTLKHVDGKPHLVMTRAGVYKLSPTPRVKALRQAIPTIPLTSIGPFLNGSRVFSQDELKHAPYVVGFRSSSLRASAGQEIYVKDMPATAHQHYLLFRPAKLYTDPQTKKRLGYLATYIGEGELERQGEPALMRLREIEQEVKLKDRVVPSDEQLFQPTFMPRSPSRPVFAEIIDLFGGSTMVGHNQVVVLNQGKNSGLEPGDVLAISKRSRLVRDPKHPRARVRLPAERVGELMVFQSFAKTSFALVMRAQEPIRKRYEVSNP